jgi:hypothetical protein
MDLTKARLFEKPTVGCCMFVESIYVPNSEYFMIHISLINTGTY